MSDSRTAFATIVILLCAALAAAGSTQLPIPIKDINTRTDGGSIYLGAAMGGYLYYGGCYQEDLFGCELVRSPIGGSGVERVKDIQPGQSGSNPTDFITVGGLVFFRANSSQLWVTDGTEAGTHQVYGFSQMYSPDQPASRWAVLGNQLFFNAEAYSGVGRELWVTDGTTTTSVNLCSGSCDGDPRYLTASGSRVFFQAYDGSDVELWKWEGGTVSKVADIHPSPGSSSYPFALGAVNGGVVFQAQDAAEIGLWFSDGVTTSKIAGSAQFFHGLTELRVAGGVAFFDGFDNYSLSGRELWISNGTVGGTGLIKDINPGVGSSDPEDFTAVGSSMFFTANDGANGRELWISTGSGANTAPLELVPGAGSPSLDYFHDLNGSNLFFAADDGTGAGLEPWISNGAIGGTFRVADLRPGSDDGIYSPVITAGGLAFFASSAGGGGSELWRSDGSAPGTVQVTELTPVNGGGGIDTIVTYNGIGYFCADDGIYGNELWRTDGTAAGTYLLHDLNPGYGFGCDGGGVMVEAGGWLYLSGYNGSSFGLWRTNGTPGGAQWVNSFAAAPQQLTAYNSSICFVADGNDGAGAELWCSSGPGATARVKDLYPGSLPANVTDLTAAHGYLYFGGRDSSTGDFELWQSNGTELGTAVLKEIRAGDAGSFPQRFAAVGSTVVFRAESDGTNGYELWKTDGTTNGTVLVQDLDVETGFVTVGAWAYFAADEASGGREVWRTNGTTTEQVADINSGSSSSFPQDFTAVGSRLMFSADDGSSGREPWYTDGTTTSRLADINGGGSSDPRYFFGTGAGNEAWFAADDGVDGSELWFTDGTEGGTVKVADLYPDGDSSPRLFASAGSTLVFTASAGVSGSELWAFGEADCGDAPDPSYPTLVLTRGACHAIAGNSLYLGATRDADGDGQPTAGADGDDLDGSDDDDGVTFTSDFNAGGIATFDVTLSAAGRLNLWIDWDADGGWTEAADHVIISQPLAGGTHGLSIPVPGDANLGTTVARFRLDSAGAWLPGGIVFDGEVEDYLITVGEVLDFGDAPDPLVATAGEYPTLLANDGARHRIVTGVHLGAGVDAESDGQPSALANGDDSAGDDEDGVVFLTALEAGETATISVSASVEGYLSAWIDFDQDGVWNSSEENLFDSEWLASGANQLGFSVPVTALPGATYARFRFDTNGDGYDPTGWVEDGEVEDYQVAVAGGATADVAIAASAPASAIPGTEIQLGLIASNSGPDAVSGATVTDLFDSNLDGCVWTCAGSGGGSCAGSGLGNIAESVDLPVGGSVGFTATCTVAADAAGDLDNTATISPTGAIDPVPADNTSTSTTTLEPTGGLSITKTDGRDWVVPPATLSYTIVVGNAGPSDAFGVHVDDLFPAELTNVAWTCAAGAGASCPSNGSGDLDETVDVAAGTAVTFTATADTVGSTGATGTVINTATLTVPLGFTDPDPADDSATDETEYAIQGSAFEDGTFSAWSAVVGGVEESAHRREEGRWVVD